MPCDHEHTEDGARVYTLADIAEHVQDEERGMGEIDLPIVGYVVVAIHDRPADEKRGDSQVPPTSVIGHRPDGHVVNSVLAIGALTVSINELERAAKLDDLAGQMVDKLFSGEQSPTDLFRDTMDVPPDATII
jgi:hypothetical protein